MANAPGTNQAWGKVRIEALSDGVFAIALTLLVLDIRLPDVARSAPSREILRALGSLGPSFLSFLITFALGGSFWYMHHATLHAVRYLTRALIGINLLFLMFVALLPFSTGLIGKLGPNHPIALAVYFTNLLALGVSLNLLWVYAKWKGILAAPATDGAIRFVIAAQPFACLAALATIAISPVASYYTFLIAMLVTRAVTRRRYSVLPTNAPSPT
jgi:uncharacterized membrane protein